MEQTQWLLALKEGDLVVVAPWRSREYTQKVERVTKTQIILGDSAKFNKQGFEVPYSMTGSCIEEPTPEKMAVVKHKVSVEKVFRLATKENFAKLTIDELLEIQALLQKN